MKLNKQNDEISSLEKFCRALPNNNTIEWKRCFTNICNAGHISENAHYLHDHGIFLLEEEAGVAVKTSYLWQENWESLSMVLDLSTLIFMKNHWYACVFLYFNLSIKILNVHLSIIIIAWFFDGIMNNTHGFVM